MKRFFIFAFITLLFINVNVNANNSNDDNDQYYNFSFSNVVNITKNKTIQYVDCDIFDYEYISEVLETDTYYTNIIIKDNIYNEFIKDYKYYKQSNISDKRNINKKYKLKEININNYEIIKVL